MRRLPVHYETQLHYRNRYIQTEACTTAIQLAAIEDLFRRTAWPVATANFLSRCQNFLLGKQRRQLFNHRHAARVWAHNHGNTLTRVAN
jgi:hypothetical protein